LWGVSSLENIGGESMGKEKRLGDMAGQELTQAIIEQLGGEKGIDAILMEQEKLAQEAFAKMRVRKLAPADGSKNKKNNAKTNKENKIKDR